MKRSFVSNGGIFDDKLKRKNDAALGDAFLSCESLLFRCRQKMRLVQYEHCTSTITLPLTFYRKKQESKNRSLLPRPTMVFSDCDPGHIEAASSASGSATLTLSEL